MEKTSRLYDLFKVHLLEFDVYQFTALINLTVSLVELLAVEPENCNKYAQTLLVIDGYLSSSNLKPEEKALFELTINFLNSIHSTATSHHHLNCPAYANH